MSSDIKQLTNDISNLEQYAEQQFKDSRVKKLLKDQLQELRSTIIIYSTRISSRTTKYQIILRQDALAVVYNRLSETCYRFKFPLSAIVPLFRKVIQNWRFDPLVFDLEDSPIITAPISVAQTTRTTTRPTTAIPTTRVQQPQYPPAFTNQPPPIRRAFIPQEEPPVVTNPVPTIPVANINQQRQTQPSQTRRVFIETEEPPVVTNPVPTIPSTVSQSTIFPPAVSNNQNAVKSGYLTISDSMLRSLDNYIWSDIGLSQTLNRAASVQPRIAASFRNQQFNDESDINFELLKSLENGDELEDAILNIRDEIGSPQKQQAFDGIVNYIMKNMAEGHLNDNQANAAYLTAAMFLLDYLKTNYKQFDENDIQTVSQALIAVF